MSVKKFKFVSPGIFINEIDNSQLPKLGDEVGPVIIGRSLRGPAMRPVRIESFSDFVETFGEPVAGGIGGDVWRDGNRIGPTYAAYAAQAYLRNASPITFVRLLGEDHPDASATAVHAGWSVGAPAASWSATTGGTGAYGLYILNGSEWTADKTQKAALAAIIYCKKGAVSLIGKSAGGASAGGYTERDAGGVTVDGVSHWVRAEGANNQFRLKIRNSVGASAAASTTNTETISFNFSRTSRNYIRKVLNTNPTLANDQITGSTALKSYFLGPPFVRHLAEEQRGITTAATATDGTSGQFAALVPLNSKANDYTAGMSPAVTPWIFSQAQGDPTEVNFQDRQVLMGKTPLSNFGIEKLFKFHSLYSGSWERKNLKISIYDIKAPTDEFNPYGTFSVMVRKADDNDANPAIVETFTSCNLNPASPDYLGRKVGDMESKWDDAERRYVDHGLYANQSRFIRVELADIVANGAADPRLLPFGFYGPARHMAAFGQDTPASTPNQAAMVLAPPVFIPGQAGHSGAYGSDFTGDSFAATPSGASLTDVVQAALHHDHLLEDVNDDGSFSTVAHVLDNAIDVRAGGSSGIGKNAGFEFLLVNPKMGARKNSLDGALSSPKDAFWGVSTNEFGSDVLFDNSYGDMAGWSTLGCSASSEDATSVGAEDSREYQFIFSLDDIRYSPSVGSSTATDPVLQADGSRTNGYAHSSTGSGPNGGGSNLATTKPQNFEWVPGCFAVPVSNDDNTAAGGTATDLPGGHCSLNAFKSDPADATAPGVGVGERNPYAAINAGCDRFTVPLVGGSDGLDIFEANPFQWHNGHANTNLITTGDSVLDHYAVNSVKKAIDTVSDPEVVEMNLLAMPGLSYPPLTAHAVNVCETRGDALAIIDIEGDYCPVNIKEGTSEAERMPNVTTAISKMRIRGLNSSYGCCFFPWVQISDQMSGRVLWAPPSIAALGTMASSSRRSELWFAPAGFTRGGLSDGAAGIPVNGVRLRLNSKERDKLYEANINPIASFPAEGIVIFGQKTLQITPSALDRINVRRLMIFLKKQISRMAKTILFDQNVKTTWARFISKAEPFLASVKGRFGLTEYKIILDETTTTPELIDRNIMYAKILLKPAKAIEFIAIDFVITDSGASFDD